MVYTCLALVGQETDDHKNSSVTHSILISSTEVEETDSLEGLNQEEKSKIQILKKRGYSRTQIIPDFFREYIYSMVYYDNKRENAYSKYIFIENGITYTTVFNGNKPEDPNFFTTANFVINNKRYWFLKINFLLEYVRIEEWLNTDSNIISMYKIFY
jgi:hypothetical protein